MRPVRRMPTINRKRLTLFESRLKRRAGERIFRFFDGSRGGFAVGDVVKMREQHSRKFADLHEYAVERDPFSDVTDHVHLSSLFCAVQRISPPFVITVERDGFFVYVMTH